MAALPPPNHQMSALDLQFDRLSLGAPQGQAGGTLHQIPHQLLPVNKLDIPRRRGIVKFFSELQLCPGQASRFADAALFARPKTRSKGSVSSSTTILELSEGKRVSLRFMYGLG